VGATDWFVKIPFLIEGAIQGFLSAVISILVLLLVYSLFSVKKIQIFGLHVLNVIFLPVDYFFFLLTVGLFLGLVGGLIAVGRFFDL
jgi:cell division transport system permease protein